jgi:hypothetical protein
MAKRKDIEITGGQAAANPNGAPEPVSAKSELPTIESPPISPGADMPATASDATPPAIEPIKAEALAVEPIAMAALAVESTADAAIKIPPRFLFRPRHKRYVLLAASVTFAAAFGAVIGALASGGFSAPARPDVAAVEQDKAMQESIAKLGKEITALKASLEQANKSAHMQFAKITELLDHGATEITGSISVPQTIPAAPPPLPTPRPAPRFAAMESQAPARVPVVVDWTIHNTRNGYVFVQSHGEVYQVQLGAPLPGLGPVQSVKRQDGRWIVLTPKGIIVSMRDRRYFEEF